MKLSNISDSSLPIHPSTFIDRKMSWLLVIFLFLILLSFNVILISIKYFIYPIPTSNAGNSFRRKVVDSLT